MGNIAAAYWSHDAGLCFYNAETNTFHTIEMEKFRGVKHYRGHGRHWESEEVLREALKIVEEDFGMKNDFDTFIIGSSATNLDPDLFRCEPGSSPGLMLNPNVVDKVFNVREYKVAYRHHAGHAWCGYAQSPWAGKKCAIFTHDAGGDDGHTFMWKAVGNSIISRQTPQWQQHRDRTFFGRSYNAASCHGVHDIASKTSQTLDIAGKIMGAAAYGDPESEWAIVGQRLYKDDPQTVEWINPMARVFKKYYLMTQEELEAVGIRGFKNGKHWLNAVFGDSPELFNPYECWVSPVGLTWQEQLDVARGIQDQHERDVLNFLKSHRDFIENCNNRLVISGGCALNVLVNKRIQEEFGIEVYVPPNSIDSGLPFGFIVQHLAVDLDSTVWRGADMTYSGPKIQDMDDLNWYKQKYPCKQISLTELSQMLKDDKILGLVQGRGEVGPRALGNRSIICDPKGKHKKDQVNIVKKREAYRPFAPMCRREDAEKYFEAYSYDNLQHMNLAVITREKYEEELAAVTHVDRTARLQTVTAEQNKFVHELLTEFGGVLLNTSFNVRGKPILNTLHEAFQVLKETALDGVIIVDEAESIWYFTKP